MNNFRKNIELAANIAIVVVAVLLCIILLKNQFAGSHTLVANGDRQTTNKEAGQRQKISLPGIDWQKNGRTLLLALSTTCHYCKESAPFYQRLAKKEENTRLIAVLPQPVDDGRKYLNDLGVTVDEVRQDSLDSIGVTGTPTLILVNREGAVNGVWVGKLPPEGEAEVLGRL